MNHHHHESTVLLKDGYEREFMLFKTLRREFVPWDLEIVTLHSRTDRIREAPRTRRDATQIRHFQW